ncbi:MAG: hypothetical protein FWG90_07765 [Oscillospiraceae bacterium]|nr:hypothetical protein [Oscillospiraceae bacterium]
MKIKAVIYFLLVAILLSSCKAVPSEVENEIIRHNKERDNDFEVSLEYIRAEDVSDSIRAALGETYKQFDFSGVSVENKIFNNIYSIVFMQEIGFEKNFQGIAELFFSEELLKNYELETVDIDDNRVDYRIYDETEKIYVCVSNNGFSIITDSFAFDSIFNVNEKVAVYHIDRDLYSDAKYQLKDAEFSIKQAVDYVEEWLASEWVTYEPFYEFKVKTIIVRKTQNNEYYFDIMVEKYLDGIPLEEIINVVSEREETIGLPYFVYTSNCIEIKMMNSNEINYFRNNFGIIKPLEKEPLEECISPKSAIEMCSNTFSDYKTFTVSDFGIKYLLMPVYDFSNIEMTSQNDDFISYKAQSMDAAGIIINSKPVWEIIIDVPPEDYLMNDEKDIYGNVRKFIYIDMITGELIFNLDIVK